MIAQKITRGISRVHEMGPMMALELVHHRFKKKWFAYHWKALWREGFTFHALPEFKHPSAIWQTFVQEIWDGSPCFAKPFDKLRTEGVPLIPRSSSAASRGTQGSGRAPSFLGPQDDKSTNSIFLEANKAARAEISILGFGTFKFTPSTIPWHTDVTCTEPSPSNWGNTFYADVIIPKQSPPLSSWGPRAGRGGTRDPFLTSQNFHPDIKIPWELSRLQHLVTLGQGYAQAHGTEDLARTSHYANAFVTTVDSWMHHNRFLHGVNWINPMEVAIRAINLIWAYSYFSNAPTIQEAWWQKFIGMLYSHKVYLEAHWEVSDRPNNHFIADLLGLFYLECFFEKQDIKNNYQKSLALAQLLKTINHQLLPDGTGYEGSTAYHRLVTEMVKHTVLLCKHFYGTVPEQLMQQYEAMQAFVDDCTDTAGNFVLIGDNDSGSVLGNTLGIFTKSFETRFEESLLRTSASLLPAHPEEKHPVLRLEGSKYKHLKTYPSFGLSIIKHPGVHITFRHPTYSTHQPTGHFHQDWLAFTLSLNGIPTFIDPGTYVYTSSMTERNALRSISAHNTFWTDFKSNLSHSFVLPRKEQAQAPVITETGNTIVISDHHNEFDQNLEAHRKILFEKTEQKLTITDWWMNQKNDKSITTHWALHTAPGITCEKQNEYWTLSYQNVTIARLETNMHLELKNSFFCPAYGKKIATQSLQGQTSLSITDIIQTTIQPITGLTKTEHRHKMLQ